MTESIRMTDAEAVAAAELVRQLMPSVGIMVGGISDGDAELLLRAMQEVSDHHRATETEVIFYMAMGRSDPTEDAEFKRQQRSVRIILKVLELRDAVKQGIWDEREDLRREEQRRQFREGTG